MTSRQFVKPTVGTGVVLVLTVVTGNLIMAPCVRADDTTEQERIQQGLAIAPVTLNLAGKDRALVGLGSYIVNAVSDCNACHNAGPGNNQFLPSGNPYFARSKMVNPATYLGGGRDFGPLVPGNSAHIVSRNLTPDKTGLPEGGTTFADFVRIIRTGVDLDHLHPTCPPDTVNPGCVPPPFDGSLLQVMPWFNFQDLTDHDLRAIYEYLSTIPCVAGPDDPKDPRHNDCGQPSPPVPSPTVTITAGDSSVTGQTLSVVQKLITLDASKSTDPNGLPLSYSWSASGPPVSMIGANTATVQVQFAGGAGQYVLSVTVSNSNGATAKGSVTVLYFGH